MSLSDAVKTIVSALENDGPDAINTSDFAPLKDYFSTVFGCDFSVSSRRSPKKGGASAAAAAAADPNEIHPDEDPDEDRWTAHPQDDSLYAPISQTECSEKDDELEQAGTLKSQAQEKAGNDDVQGAIDLMTKALQFKPTAMNFAYRAHLYLQIKALHCAVKDADRALELNPESARAARVRGTARRHQGNWVQAADDLNHAQQCDFDEGSVALAKFCTERAMKIKQAQWHREQEAELAKAKAKAVEEHLRKQREEEAEEAAKQAAAGGGGMGGMPGGMGGMPGMGGGMPGMGGGMPGGMGGGAPPGAGGGMGGLPADLLNDPELAAAMADPEVAQKMASVMQNPMAAMQMMGDPKMGPIITKLMSKMMGGQGAGGGMPGMPGMGGMGGAGGMPGMPGGFPGAGAGGFPGARTAPPQSKPQSKPSDDLD